MASGARLAPAWRAKSSDISSLRRGSFSEREPQIKEAKRVFTYDPRHPVPTVGGTVTSGQPLMVGVRVRSARRPGVLRLGSSRGDALSERPDVLVFQTAPLTADVETHGAIEAELWISSNCPDTDFTIKLIDVYPPNEDYPQGFCNESYRWHPSLPLPRFLGATRDARAWSALRDSHLGLSRPRICSWPDIAFAWISRPVTSRISTSIQTPASRKGAGGECEWRQNTVSRMRHIPRA